VLGKVGFQSLGEFTPGQQDAPAAAFALKPDIRAQTRDVPFVGAARVLFSEAKMVVEMQIG